MKNRLRTLIRKIYFLAGHYAYPKIALAAEKMFGKYSRRAYFLGRFAYFKTAEIAVKMYIKYILWGLFRPYHEGLLTQAKYLYEQTPMYEERKKIFGAGFAKRSFEENDASFFMWKARQEPFSVKWQIFKNAFWCRPSKPIIKENS